MRVRGNAGRAERTIAGYLNKLTEREVFNRYDAERYLLLAGDLPGYNVRLALRSAGAGARRGDRRGDGRASAGARRRHRPESRLARARPLGRAGAAQIFGLTGLGDRTTLAGVQHRRHRRAADGPGRATISGSAARASRSAASSPMPGPIPTSAMPRSTSNRAPCSPPWRRATPSSAASCGRCAARSAST